MFTIKEKKESLEGILEVFTTTKNRLIQFIENKRIEDASLEAQILDLNQDRQEVLEERSKAEVALNQINQITGE